ncbi:unnamed protein product [Rotaria magnacalcarata]|uniref:Uncharacterized protein n=2 Tax=Rotaria magnacalcarata TaxID=392030 RepID=A0A816V4J0_9BILA|nr:unnamed protein product [Rotaria magnacalcarata]CAF2093635.1 unnamed protein product [Rotaria magnacalcarata]CAF2115603.1 unnamed protein product [Rotaria magnacalcarata]CAF3977674.1 unnamed protein product [Rotaria magnacalcarata]
MCDRTTSLSDPTADFVLSDLLSVTEDLIDFSINVLDTIRLQSHFNDRNRRISLAMQLQDVLKAQNAAIANSTKPCVVPTTLKYDLALYLDRILQACRRTKSNLMLLRVSRLRSANTTLLLVASTNVRVEQLNRKVQLLTRLVKENGGEFYTKKKKKKNIPSKTRIDQNTETKPENKKPSKEKQPLNLMSKEDLNDYVEISLSFRMIITKFNEFMQRIRDASKSMLSSNGQATIANSFVLIPIAANAIGELNNILNRLVRIAYTVESESNYLRQSPPVSTTLDSKELYRQDTKTNETGSSRTKNLRPAEAASQKEEIQHTIGSNLKRSNISLMKQDEARSNIRNQSAMSSTSHLGTTTSNSSSFKLTPNMIANIFDDFFNE